MYTVRSIVRSVVDCRPYVSPGNPITPSGARRLAAVLNAQRPSAAMQLAVACISMLCAGLTGMDASAVLTAAVEGAMGVTSASDSHIAEITASMPANRFVTLLPSGAACGDIQVRCREW